MGEDHVVQHEGCREVDEVLPRFGVEAALRLLVTYHGWWESVDMVHKNGWD